VKNFLLDLPKRLNGFCQRRPYIALVAGVALFVAFVVGASVYADILTWDFPLKGGRPVGLGFHVTVVATLAQYDAQHYLHIARAGYEFVRLTAFLPLYPLMIHVVAALTRLSYEWSALLISWLALGGAALVIYNWAKFELRNYKVSPWAPWLLLGLLAVFPTSFYFVLPYTESLFVLLSVAALWMYRRDNYWIAAICTALATATRYQGAVLCLFFLADFVLAKQKNWRKLIPIVLGGAGLAAYMVYLWVHFGSPLEFLQAEKDWQRLSGNVIVSLARSFTPLYLWFLGVLGVGLWGVWKYLGRAYFIYSLVFILLPLSSGRFDSINRYMLGLLPMFLAFAIMAEHKPPAVLKLFYICSSVFLLAWSILLFANGYWVA
jgi:hypothetical protein